MLLNKFNKHIIILEMITILNKIYLEISLLINNHLHEQNKIAYQQFLTTQENLLKRIKKEELK